MENQDIRIYNLFPRLYGGIQEWLKAARHARDMGFDTLYLNPMHETSVSGSIYAIRDYEAYDPVALPGLSREEAEAQLRQFLLSCREMGLRVLCDLVINHTAIDSPLTVSHPDWFVMDSDGSIRCAGAFTFEGDYTEWKDCAKLDYSRPQSGLWEYAEKLCRRYLELGFSGFRCDVAAHVPARFWRHLIDRLKKEYPDVLFLGEVFLATPGQIHALAQAGFQYMFNSAHWWDYKEPWLIEQNNRNRNIIHAIAFPENHDTQRAMAAECGSIPRFCQRLQLTGLLSAGWMITSGFEYGFQKRLHVSQTRKSDWETTQLDFTSDICRIMNLRDKYPVFRMDGELSMLPSGDDRVCLLSKTIPGQQALLLLNLSDQEVLFPMEDMAEMYPYHALPNRMQLAPYDLHYFVDSAEEADGMPINTSYCLEPSGKMVLHSIPLKPLRSGEALVEIQACGICGSDYREMRHGRFYWKRMDEGGHEWTGRIVSLLPDGGFKPGDLVAYRLPRQGVGMTQGGGFSRYAVVHQDCLYPLDAQDDPIRSVMIEPLAVVVHAAKMLLPGENIAIVGSGTLALLTERLLRILRPSCRITLLYKHDHILRHTSENTNCIPFPPERLKEEWDIIVECSGAGQSVPALLPGLQQGGQLLLLGIYGSVPPVNLADVMFRELKLHGSFLYEEEDFEKAAQLIRSGAVMVDDLVQIVPFERAKEAFTRPSGQRIKTVITHKELGRSSRGNSL